MHNIFKPKNIISLEDTVSIPDAEFKVEITESAEENETEVNSDEDSADNLYEENYKKITEKILSENEAFIKRKRHELEQELEKKTKASEMHAEDIINKAQNTAKQIIREAENQSEKIKNTAYSEGLNKGIEEKCAVLDNLSTEISDSMKQIIDDENQYFEEYALEMKKIAIDICEKIICQKIEDDDLLMYNIIKSAVKSVRDVAWIRAEVSSDLAGFIDSLENELRANGQKVEFTLRDDVSKDTCILNTSVGIVIANVKTQLDNLRGYINTLDKGGNNEDKP